MDGLNHITEVIIDAAIEVHKALGPGLLESVYESCMAYELAQRRIGVERQVEVPVRYREVELDCGFRMDLLVEGVVPVDVERVQPIHKAQLLTYMRLAGYELGLLINFNVRYLKDGICRLRL